MAKYWPGYTVEIWYLDYTDTLEVVEYRAAAALADPGAVRDLFEDIITGTIFAIVEVFRDVKLTPGVMPPTDPNSQSSIRWQVNYFDTTTGNTGQYYIPTANLSLLPSGTEEVNTGFGLGADVADLFEAAVLSDDGNAITVTRILYDGD